MHWCDIVILELLNLIEICDHFIEEDSCDCWLWVNLFVIFISYSFMSCCAYCVDSWYWYKWDDENCDRNLYQSRCDVEVFIGDIIWCRGLSQWYDVMSKSLLVILWYRGLCWRYWIMLRSLLTILSNAEVFANDYCMSFLHIHIWHEAIFVIDRVIICELWLVF